MLGLQYLIHFTERNHGGRGDRVHQRIPHSRHLDPQRFICSQGPKENTVNDFWLMLWENEVRHLVMVTKLVERGKKKCECYWPQRVGDGERRGDLFVTLVKLEPSPTCSIKL